MLLQDTRCWGNHCNHSQRTPAHPVIHTYMHIIIIIIIMLTLKTRLWSFKVTTVATFTRLHTSSYSSSTATMAVSGKISGIKWELEYALEHTYMCFISYKMHQKLCPRPHRVAYSTPSDPLADKRGVAAPPQEPYPSGLGFWANVLNLLTVATFTRLHTSSYSSSTATMAVSCKMSETKRELEYALQHSASGLSIKAMPNRSFLKLSFV